MFFQKSLLSLHDFLRLNVADYLFLSQFNAMNPSEKIAKIRALLSENQFDFIVKLACASKEFREICLNPGFSDDWLGLWSTFGIILTGKTKGALLRQSCPHVFDLFLGIYFYNEAVSHAEAIKKIDSQAELNYLQEAIKYGSIHALQRYSRYLYNLIETNQLEVKEAEGFLTDIIESIKDLLPYYTSYAYLMLAEAYVRYSFLNPEQHIKAERSAIIACTHAKKLYQENDPAIFNASLGVGLAASNTMHFATPDEAMNGIKNLFDNGAPLTSCASPKIS